MVDYLDAFLIGQAAFTERVRAISDEQWALGTPNEQWNVAELVAHLITEHRWAPPLLHGLDLDAAAKVVDGARCLPVDGGVGANYAAAWEDAAIASADAFSADGALERKVQLGRGETFGWAYLKEMIFDMTVHAWDLCRAIGYAHDLPAELVDAVWEESRKYGSLAASGLFDGPVDVPEDAPTIHRLVAMTGRDPS